MSAKKRSHNKEQSDARPGAGSRFSDQETAERLQKLLEPVIRSEGLILVELVFRSEGGGKVLRLFVDRPEGGIILDECAMLSRQISDLLDVEDLVAGPHRLEVSSPGLERRLKTGRDFEIFAGRQARLVFRDQADEIRELTGRLKGIQGQDILVESEGRIKAVPQDRMVKANLVVEF